METQRAGLIRNVLHLGVSQVITTVVMIITNAVLSRTLGAAEFGLLYVIVSIATFAYVFVDWGHAPYVTREVARQPERAGEMLGTAIVVRTGMALLMCLVAVLFMWLAGYEWRVRLLGGALVLALLPQYLSSTFSWVFRARERMDYDAIIQVATRVCTLLVTLAFFAVGGRLLGYIGAIAAAGIITWVMAGLMYRKLALTSPRVSSATARELIRCGAPMMGVSLAVAAQPVVDANLLYNLAPAEVAGWYGAAWSIAGTLVAPAVVIGATVYPRLSKVSNDPAEFASVFRAALRPLLLLSVLGGVGTFLFADLAIDVAFSNAKFGEAASILRAFVPLLMLVYINVLFGYSVMARGGAGRLAKIKFVAVILATGLELALIPLFQARFSNGGIGLMVASACGELVMVIGTIALLRDLLDRAMLLDAIRALVAGALTVAILSWFVVTPLIAIPLCVVMFGAWSFALGLVRVADLSNLLGALRNRSATRAPASALRQPDAVAVRGQ